MASPWFEALTVQCPGLPADQVERFARVGIDEFVRYLQRAKKHQERRAVRAAWRLDEESPAHGDAVWVELLQPDGHAEKFEREVKKFFADQVREVFESEPPVPGSPPDVVFTDASRAIAVLESDENAGRLLLAREPELRQLVLRPNTYPLHCQIRAMQQLKNEPRSAHLPLLRLLGPSEARAGRPWTGRSTAPPVRWPEPRPEPLGRWFLLDEDVVGVSEQRRFVEQALASPDFAVLEGPPGSGKTQVICELVMQFIERGKRVLLCASTHVAVDNVLERLKSERFKFRDHVLAVRIGDAGNVSKDAKPYCLEEFMRTVRESILAHLRRVPARSGSQELMLKTLRGDEGLVERVVLECANVVCGTTIGILQHPEIRAQRDERRGTDAVFDVLIVDEASKTTFQEFLVPGLLAKKWVLVGDPLQLSPYVEDDEIAANVQAALDSEVHRQACLDVFDNMNEDPSRWKPVVVVSDDPAVHEVYAKQASHHGVAWADGDRDSALMLHGAPLVLSTTEGVGRADMWPADVAVVRGDFEGAAAIRRRARGYPASRTRQRLFEDDRSWEGEVAWRVVREYEQRVFERNGTESDRAHTYRRDRQRLLPCEALGVSLADVQDHVSKVQAVALPSVLESLRHGFSRPPHHTPTALSEGLPPPVLDVRHTRLSYQRRMHPDISMFPRTHVYQGEALQDVPEMLTERRWPGGGWTRYASRAVWVDVRPRADHGRSRIDLQRQAEAAVVIEELRVFLEWASRNPPHGGGRWKVGVLTFYRAQERILRRALRVLTGERHEMSECLLSHAGRAVAIAHVCTVDRFQGHEADVVYVSVGNFRPTDFLESPNRLNVAVTRARYQLVVVGNRIRMAEDSRTPVLAALARTLPYDLRYSTAGEGRRA